MEDVYARTTAALIVIGEYLPHFLPSLASIDGKRVGYFKPVLRRKRRLYSNVRVKNTTIKNT